MRSFSFMLLVVAMLTACVNGKEQRGTLLHADSLPVRDTVATLSPDMPSAVPKDSTEMDGTMEDSLLLPQPLHE